MVFEIRAFRVVIARGKWFGGENGDGEGGVESGYRCWSLGEAGAGKGRLVAPAMRVISHRACASLAESGVDS
jgi:hypothetical protein